MSSIKNPIAEFALVRIDGRGRESLLVARVGAPYRVDSFNWACPAELEGVDGRYPDICGENGMQALALALRLFRQRLGHLLEMGQHLCDANDTRIEFDGTALDCLFGASPVPLAPPQTVQAHVMPAGHA